MEKANKAEKAAEAEKAEKAEKAKKAGEAEKAKKAGEAEKTKKEYKNKISKIIENLKEFLKFMRNNNNI